MHSYQRVYLKIENGCFYTRTDFPMSHTRKDHCTLSGKPSFMISPVFRLFTYDENEPSIPGVEIYDFPVDNSQRMISVGKNELDTYFKEVVGVGAVQESNIEDLLQIYEHEGRDSNPKGMAAAAHRLARTMRDSQARCLLELMARFIDAQQAKESKDT